MASTVLWNNLSGQYAAAFEGATIVVSSFKSILSQLGGQGA